MSTADRWRSLLHGTVDDRRAALADLDSTLAVVNAVIPGAEACSITELDGDAYRTTAASAPIALALDLAQYADGDGPCMTAARERRRQQVPDTRTSNRFDAYVAAAARRGVRSSLSIPITSAGRNAALNIYSRQVGGFDEHGRAIADLAGRVLTSCLRAEPTAPLSDAEVDRISHRRELMRAALLPAVSAGATPQEAFEELARRSSAEGRSIFDLATEIVDGSRGSA
jgi:GAF domain-containing protein